MAMVRGGMANERGRGIVLVPIGTTALLEPHERDAGDGGGRPWVEALREEREQIAAGGMRWLGLTANNSAPAAAMERAGGGTTGILTTSVMRWNVLPVPERPCPCRGVGWRCGIDDPESTETQ